ncbi:MAG: beta-galactosidase [Kiritimatiellia bacterium]
MRLFCLALAPLALLAKPMIDESHDRVQTSLDPQLDRIGTLTPRSAREIGPSRLAIGCEMLPRGYGEFENFKDYMPPLGIARVRLHAGWAKLEPRPGTWDWDWLDRQVEWLVANGLEPLLETSYGNPAYPGAGGASLSDGIPRGEAALAAWDNYVEQLAKRYPQVKNWACWNEPNNIRDNGAELVADNNIRTARIIKRHIPDAKIGMLSLGWCDLAFTKACFKVFRERDALKLFHWAIMHDYSPNPDVYYAGVADKWAAFVRQEAPHLRIWNGESGATSDPHFSAAISSLKWNSELTQAKWNARRLIGDLGHGFDSLVFTMYDPCYDCPERYCNHIPKYWVRTRPDRFMKRMGLVKCNDRLEVVKVKIAYYTVQNVATLFDRTIEPGRFTAKPVKGETAGGLVVYTFRQRDTGIPLVAFWDASTHPVNENEVRRTTLSVRGAGFKDPVWIDMVTGAIYDVPARMFISWREKDGLFEDVPYYDAPVVLTERALVMAR